MHLHASISVLLCLLPCLGLALPAAANNPAKGGGNTSKAGASKAAAPAAKATPKAGGTAANPGAMADMMTPSDTQIGNAVMSWMNNTAKVTKFLDTATSLSGDEFTKQATIALNAEKDELNHKMILDMALGMMDMVQTANNTLATQGTFQAVVDTLQDMVTGGPDMSQAQVNAINMNRCVNVLPNIDMYFAAAGSPMIKSAVPTGCLEVDPANASAVPPGGAANNGTASGNTPSSSAGKASTTNKPGAGKASNAGADSPATAASKAGAPAKTPAASGTKPQAATKSTGAQSATNSMAGAAKAGGAPKAAAAGGAKAGAAKDGSARAKAAELLGLN